MITCPMLRDFFCILQPRVLITLKRTSIFYRTRPYPLQYRLPRLPSPLNTCVPGASVVRLVRLYRTEIGEKTGPLSALYRYAILIQMSPVRTPIARRTGVRCSAWCYAQRCMCTATATNHLTASRVSDHSVPDPFAVRIGLTRWGHSVRARSGSI